MRLRFTHIILTAALICLLPMATWATPPLNTPCTVYLRRDATGALTETVAIRVAISGKIKSTDKEWICLDADEGAEVWIPMASVQYIAFTKPRS